MKTLCVVSNTHDIHDYSKVEVMDLEGRIKVFTDVTDERLKHNYQMGYGNGFNAGFALGIKLEDDLK